MQIHSYRTVFELERRIYRIDSLRLNPSGVPLRGVAYFLVLLALVILGGVLPLIGPAVRAIPWYARGLIAPATIAAGLTVTRVDGRPFHLAALSLAGMVGPRRTRCWPRSMSNCRGWHPQDVVVLSDGSEGRLRRLRYTGPGTVRVALRDARPVLRLRSSRGPWGWTRGTTLQLSAAAADPDGRASVKVIALAPGARFEAVT